MKCRRCMQEFETDETELDDIEGAPVDDVATDDDERICGPCLVERAKPVPPLDIEATFGPGGPLSAGKENYEARPGQVRLARAIFDGLAQGHHLLAEGPCGIGKSMAYGVPAAYLASHGKRVLIVTASIALQEQLVMKDLPALQKMLPWKFSFALMKGKSNYLCKEQIGTADNAGLGDEDRRAFAEIAKWSETTKRGDKSELLIKPSDLVWGRFSTASDECPGKKCASYKTCYATRARETAAAAGIVVCNYHLFFLNMAYGGTILPAADVVILDEAHEAADIARDLLGFKLSMAVIRRIANDAQKRGCGHVAVELRRAGEQVFDTLGRFHDSPHYKSLLRWAVPIDPTPLEDALDAFVNLCPRSHLVMRAMTARRRIREALEVSDPNCVYWIDVKESFTPGAPRRVSIEARYVNPGPMLSDMLWGAYPSIVAVSATLTTDGRFDFVRGELGVPAAARELCVESPFDFQRQAMLVVPPPTELPEPNDPSFVAVAAQRIIETIEACGGRTLGLFTSYRQLNAVYDRVRAHFGNSIRILRQGEMPVGLLTKTFKEDVRSVLLGTTSFWTGIDVPGEALTGVVIDRLPFGQPDDPVSIRINETDPKAFAHYTVPKSILVLRQGAGRLIRSQRDVGVIVILDKRLTTKGYGARFLKSLPPMQRVASTRAIAPFLRSKGVAA